MIKLAQQTLLATVGLVWLGTASAIAAVDAVKFRAALEGQLAIFGGAVKLGSIEGRGDDIIISDVRTTADGGSKTFASIRLENVTAVRGGFNIARISFPPTTIQESDGSVEFGGATLRDITIPEPGAPKDVILYWLVAEVGQIRLANLQGKDFIRSGPIRMTNAPMRLDKDVTFVVEPFDLLIDTTQAPKSAGSDPSSDEALQELAALGLSRLDMRMASSGFWRPTDGRLSADTTFELRNGGKLTMGMGFSGYTIEVIQALNEASKAMVVDGKRGAGQPKQDMDAKAAMAFIGIAQQLGFAKFSVRYDDASLAGRVLDYAARKNGVQRRELINQIKGMVPVLAMQTNDADFATRTSNAVSAFLDNPKSIQIQAEPPAPVPFMQLFAIGSVAPQALIKQLNVNVLANQ